MSDEGRFVVERDGAVAHLIVDRPRKLNTVTIAMARDLQQIARDLNTDDDVRAVVLRSRGDRAFSAGSDVGALDAYGDPWHLRHRADLGQDYIAALWSIRKPVIAALRGYVYGGGLEMAMCADMRLASPTATFAAAEIKLGWHAGSGQTQLLSRIVGVGKAAQMLMTGEPIDATEAHRVRLVDELVGDDELDQRASALAATVASNPPIAVQLTKHLVRVSQNTTLENGWSQENDLHVFCMTTRDAQEGIRAFAERRAPIWEGR